MKTWLTILFVFISLGCGVWVGNPQEGDDEAEGFKANVEVVEAPPPASLNLWDFDLWQETEFAANPVYDYTTSTKIESYSLPLLSINLINDTTILPLYICAGNTSAECHIQSTGEALKSLLKSENQQTTWPDPSALEIVFDRIQINYQDISKPKWAAKIKTSAVINGLTYYTKADGTVSTSAPAEEAEWFLSGSGPTYRLPKPIKATPTSVLDIRIYLDTAHVAKFLLSGGDQMTSESCIGNQTAGFCMEQPQMVATVDTSSITAEHYILSVADSTRFPGKGCVGFVGLYVNADDIVLGGYVRNYTFPKQDCGGSGMTGGGITNVTILDSGAVSFEVWGMQQDKPDFIYTSFSRANHQGTLDVKFSNITDWIGLQKYDAKRID